MDVRLANIPAVVANPSIVGPVLMNWGVNDIGFTLDKATWEGNYETIISYMHTTYPYSEMWLAYPWRADCCSDQLATLHTWIDDVIAWCPSQGIVCHAGPDEHMVLNFSGAYDSGGVHYSADGAAAMAAAWKTALGW